MAAEQAAELYTETDVTVLKSKSLALCYATLASMNPEGEKDEIVATFDEVSSRVVTGYVSPSIRDADMNGVHINSGDTIGIINKEIVVSDADKMTATCTLASMLLDLPEKFMLTVFCGEDSSEDEKEKLTQYLGEKYPDAEVYFIDGGQEIYPYIFVAE